MERTKKILIDVARRLFAEIGKDKTTMNDIAAESKKGRRTLYTYFRNKDDIYLAVIENELKYMLTRLENVVDKNISPDKKLEEYIFTHLETFKVIIQRNGSLRASFFQNAIEVERARRTLENKEIQMLRQILAEGMQAGVFRIQNPQWAAEVALNLLKGLEKPYYKEKFNQQMLQRKESFMDLLFNGISAK